MLNAATAGQNPLYDLSAGHFDPVAIEARDLCLIFSQDGQEYTITMQSWSSS